MVGNDSIVALLTPIGKWEETISSAVVRTNLAQVINSPGLARKLFITKQVSPVFFASPCKSNPYALFTRPTAGSRLKEWIEPGHGLEILMDAMCHSLREPYTRFTVASTQMGRAAPCRQRELGRTI